MKARRVVVTLFVLLLTFFLIHGVRAENNVAKAPPYANGYRMVEAMELIQTVVAKEQEGGTKAEFTANIFDLFNNTKSSFQVAELAYEESGCFCLSRNDLPLVKRGRMHVSDHDELVMLYWSAKDNNVYLKGYDPINKKEYGPLSVTNVGYSGGSGGIVADMAVGDLDGDSKDEAVVAYRTCNTDSMSCRSTVGGYVSLKVFTSDNKVMYGELDDGVSGIMRLLIGDFNGDGKNELLLITQYVYGSSDYEIDFFKLINGKLQRIKTVSFSSPYDGSNSCWSDSWFFDIAGGNMDDDPAEEVAITNTRWHVGIINFSDDLSIGSFKKEDSSSGSCSGNHHSDFKVVTADIDGDSKKEIVTVSVLPKSATQDAKYRLRIYSMDESGAPNLLKEGTLDPETFSKYPPDKNTGKSFCDGYNVFDVAAGNFDGSVNKDNIELTEEVAIASTCMLPDSSWLGTVWVLDLDKFVKSSSSEIAYKKLVAAPAGSCGSFRNNLVAADLNGVSLMLGPPEVYEIEGHLDYTAVIAEPPKHIDFIKDIKGNWTELNISRVIGVPGIGEAFYTELKDKSGNAMTVTDKHTTDQNFAVGIKTDVGVEKKVLGVTFKGYVKAAGGYSFNHHKEKWNESYTSVEMANDVKALDDDYLVYRSQEIYLWIYPVVGVSGKTDNGEKGQLFVEVSRPGSFKKRFLPGKNVEWYQPVHENGNLFSYPWSEDNMEGFEASKLKTERTTIGLGGGEVEEEVVWAGSSESGNKTSWTHKMNYDLTFGFKAKVYFLKFGASLHTHYDQAWTHLHTSVSETSTSRGITVGTCPVNVNYAYQFSPYIYEHKDLGCMDINYTVDLSYGEASQWWRNLSGYSSNADLALNLPWRWVAYKNEDTDKWEFRFNEGAEDLKKSKSIFFLDENDKPFGYVVKAGKKVKIKARIYNYSFVRVDDNATVRFEYQKGQTKRVWDDKEKRWVYKVVWGEREKIADVKIPSIPAYQNPFNEPNWRWAETILDTTGLEGNYLRIWVTVDPDNEITEIYGHDNGDKYDNNEGYSGVNLAVVSDDDLEKLNVMTVSSKRGHLYGVADVEKDLMVDEVRFSDEAPKEGETVDVTARIRAEGANFSHVTVYFYDDDPEKGGSERPFDVEMIPFLRDGESYEVRVKYRTEDKGGKTVKIYAEVEARRGEKSVENNVDLGEIYVREAKGSWRDEVIGALKH